MPCDFFALERLQLWGLLYFGYSFIFQIYLNMATWSGASTITYITDRFLIDHMVEEKINTGFLRTFFIEGKP